ncbi:MULTISPECIES: hypothetical protein [Tenacibaculum]|uniref:hypothetical protein n=1 Tax=Tenacibaculum TaxID=104267 RepID=UPI001F336B58|nr:MULTISPECIES: hypothetical protein [Tenacibaculum]MCF2875250.1 hypothetical protein [Tenacibaculum sp. Cn5-1]MCF2935326.1 hypothetical protein [Tenacibaculum sp. Cn5-34]MCG7511232.1 hypothetical protein [Tenacibaculum sp. Cn5-46]
MVYKITLTICLLITTIFQGISQNLVELSVKEYSQKADYEKEHIHKLQIKNNGLTKASYQVNLTNVLCKKKNTVITEFDYSLYDENMNPIRNEITVDINEIKTFYLKITKPNNLNLGKWSCTQLEISEVSNPNAFRRATALDKITLKSYIPNPSSDN